MITATQIKHHFDEVALKMSGLPVFNAELSVACLGFEPSEEKGVEGYAVGVLVTPWCMNLMLVPSLLSKQTSVPQVEKGPGEKQLITFPSGVYEFIHVEGGALGRYLSCSLFSPMFEFKKQADAVDTALAALDAIDCDQNEGLTDLQRARKEQVEDKSAAEKTAKQPPRQLSRRGFLTAGLSHSESR